MDEEWDSGRGLIWEVLHCSSGGEGRGEHESELVELVALHTKLPPLEEIVSEKKAV